MAAMPAGKLDTDAAKAIVSLGFPAVEPVLTEILEWLQDMNWPVARVFEPFLTSIGAPLAPFIRRAFAANDTIWSAWLVLGPIRHSPELAATLEPELRAFLALPSADGDLEWLRAASVEALEANKRWRPDASISLL